MKHFNHLLDYNLEISPCFDFYETDRQNNYRFTFATSLFYTELCNKHEDFICFFIRPLCGINDNWDVDDDEQEVDAYLEAKQLEFAIGKAINKLEISNQKSNNSKNRI